jgi:hypothetical protein
MNNFTITCPHCNLLVLIEKLNCAIFRHGIITKTLQQIPPHASKNECENYIKNGIIGCGKPFKVIIKDKEYIAIECDYI